MAKRTLNPPLLIGILAAHLIVTSLTWRSLRHRAPDQVRGGKKFWRVASAMNTLGSAAYVLLGRRPAD